MRDVYAVDAMMNEGRVLSSALWQPSPRLRREGTGAGLGVIPCVLKRVGAQWAATRLLLEEMGGNWNEAAARWE